MSGLPSARAAQRCAATVFPKTRLIAYLALLALFLDFWLSSSTLGLLATGH